VWRLLCAVTMLILAGPTPAWAQSASSAEVRARQRQAEVERRIREGKARIDEAIRNSGGSSAPSWRGPPAPSTPGISAPGISVQGKAWLRRERAKRAARQPAPV